MAISLCDLGGEREPAEPLDLDVEIGDPDGSVQHPNEVRFAQLVRAGLRADAREQAPAGLASAAGEYRTVHRWMLEHVEGVATVPDRIVEVGGELDPLVDGELVRAFHPDAQHAPHVLWAPSAATTYRALPSLLARSSARPADLDPFAVLEQTDEFVAEAHRRRWRRTETRQQQRFVVGLRRPRRTSRTDRRGLCVRRIPERHHDAIARRQRPVTNAMGSTSMAPAPTVSSSPKRRINSIPRVLITSA